jgi:hypothetical protein
MSQGAEQGQENTLIGNPRNLLKSRDSGRIKPSKSNGLENLDSVVPGFDFLGSALDIVARRAEPRPGTGSLGARASEQTKYAMR